MRRCRRVCDVQKEYEEVLRKERMQSEAIRMGEWLIEHKCTIRKLAEEFCLSRTTVHRRVLSLKGIDTDLYHQCRKILDENKKDCIHRMTIAKKKPRE